jgi:hypothetical protein
MLTGKLQNDIGRYAGQPSEEALLVILPAETPHPLKGAQEDVLHDIFNFNLAAQGGPETVLNKQAEPGFLELDQSVKSFPVPSPRSPNEILHCWLLIHDCRHFTL